MLIIEDEGDEWWARMSKNASMELRGATLSWINQMVDGDELLVELKTKHLTTRASNFNNTILLYGHPVEFIRNFDCLRSMDKISMGLG